MTRVREKPPALICSGPTQRMRAANPIYGRGQWYEMAEVASYLIGRGNTLCSATPVEDRDGTTAITQGASGLTFTHWISPNSTTKTYLWLVSLTLGAEAAGVAGSASGEFQTSASAQLGQWTLGPSDAGGVGLFRVLYHAAGTPTEDAVFLKIINYSTSQSEVFLSGLQLIELPRLVLPDSPNEQTCDHLDPIYEAASHKVGLDGAIRYIQVARSAARRAHLISQWMPTAVHVTSGTLETVSYAVIRPRSMVGNDSATVNWRAYCRATGGDGEIRVVTTQDGGPTTDTDTVTIPSGGYGFVSGTITARAEDPANLAAGGLRDDEIELLGYQLRVTTGTSVDLKGFWAWEAA